MKPIALKVGIVTLWGAFQTFALSPDSTVWNRTTISGHASYELGQIYRGMYKGRELWHDWQQRMVGSFTITSNPLDWLTVYLGAETELTYSVVPNTNYLETLTKYVTFYPDHLEGVAGLLRDPRRIGLDIGLGYFPYKYNPQARDLGEYLFRSSCYPSNLSTDFDYPRARLLGLRVHNTLFGMVSQDLLLTSETEYTTLKDYTLTWIPSVKYRSIVDLGVGVSFARVFPVDKAPLTPKYDDNRYIDSSKSTTNPDTGWYTFRGTKLMGRITIDPKELFPSKLFGPEDLRLYSEVAVLGVKDYPGYYDELWRRIPLMIGFNLPAFKVLDVLAFEVEYYRNRYPNSYAKVMPMSVMGTSTMLPLPASDVVPVGDKYENDNLKWALYAKRSVFRHLTVVAQVANDHLRTRSAQVNDLDREETLQYSGKSVGDAFINGHWYYMFKMQFAF